MVLDYKCWGHTRSTVVQIRPLDIPLAYGSTAIGIKEVKGLHGVSTVSDACMVEIIRIHTMTGTVRYCSVKPLVPYRYRNSEAAFN